MKDLLERMRAAGVHTLLAQFTDIHGVPKGKMVPLGSVLDMEWRSGPDRVVRYNMYPSAEVQGHGPGQEVLQTGKRAVGVLELEPVGNYAVKPVFSDGHQSGIFSWDYLYFLGVEQTRLWDDYQRRIEAAGAERDAPMAEASGHACSKH